MTKSICANCAHPIEDIAFAIVKGCPKCGEKKIMKARGAKTINREDKMDENIGIIMKGRGEYVFNLKALTNRISQKDPLFVADSEGKINVLFNSED